MKDLADGAEVVGLVRPGQLEIGQTAGKRRTQLTHPIAQGTLGKHKQGRAIGRDQIGNAHAIDGSNGANSGPHPELVHTGQTVAYDDGAFVSELHRETLAAGRSNPTADNCSKVDRSAI
jgi:hypothetical protein